MKTIKFLLSGLSFATLALTFSACGDQAVSNTTTNANLSNTTTVNSNQTTANKSSAPSNAADAAGAMESVYTDLSPTACKTVKEDKETGGSVQKCPGIEGYELMVEDDDARQSVTVLTPDGKRHPLDYWQVVTTAFSSVGDKAEWRVKRDAGGKAKPVALIVRVNANENPEASTEKTSYLAVAKITPEKICVTEKVKNGAQMNEEARRAADASADKPCLK